MYKKNTTAYAEPGELLVSSSPKGRKISFKVSGYATLEVLSTQLNVKAMDSGRVQIYDNFICTPPSMAYEAIKTHIIKMVFSQDDQLALMLNKDTPDGAMLYAKMQEWRAFAAEVAKAIEDQANPPVPLKAKKSTTKRIIDGQ